MKRVLPTGVCRVLTIASLVFVVAGCGARMSDDPAPQIAVAMKLRSAGGESTSAAKTAVATGTGWGSLRGAFKVAGAIPDAGTMSTAGKDGAVCGAQVPNETLVIDGSSKGIANVVVFARKVSRVKDELAKPPATEALFDQKACLFLSHVLVVRTKQPVLLKNSDPIGHNTALNPPGNPPANPLLPSGGSATYAFSKQLTAPAEATCSIHPWMKAYLMARDDPYFAVTSKDGSFEIANLPAGEEIEFQVWHERAPGLSAGKIVKGKFKVKIPENGVENLPVEVPVAAFN